MGVYVTVGVDAKARFDIMCVVDEAGLKKVNQTDMPIVYYESPVTLLQAITRYSDEHGVDAKTPVRVMVPTQAVIGVYTVGQYSAKADQIAKADAEWMLENEASELADKEMEHLDQDESDREFNTFNEDHSGGSWNPPY